MKSTNNCSGHTRKSPTFTNTDSLLAAPAPRTAAMYSISITATIGTTSADTVDTVITTTTTDVTATTTVGDKRPEMVV
jgi:hypothetical protein